MRAPAIVLGLTLIAAACGGANAGGTAIATVPTTTDATTDATTDETTVENTAPTATTKPVIPPPTVPGERPVDDGGSASVRPELAIAVALLPDDAFAAPWELQWRELERTGYGAGPNQTDCAAYWAVEELRGGDGGHVMWWVDGGNANHYVSRFDGANGVHLVAQLASLATSCPVVRWLEGGSFATESIELADGVGFRFTDAESGETTWFAAAVHRDVVSVLDIPLWTNIDGDAFDFDAGDLDRLTTQMYQLLLDAEAAPPEVTVPPIAQPRPTTPPPEIVPPPTTSLPPVPTTISRDLVVTGVGKLLLGEAELPDRFDAPRVQKHRPDGPDDDLVAICPSGVSIERIDAMLEWGSMFEDHDGLQFNQIIGRADSVDAAVDVVDLFAETASCDLSASWGADAETSGGAIGIDGADAAASLVLQAVDGSFSGEIVALAVGDLVMIVSVGSSDAVSPSEGMDLDVADAIAELAVAKVLAARN